MKKIILAGLFGGWMALSVRYLLGGLEDYPVFLTILTIEAYGIIGAFLYALIWSIHDNRRDEFIVGIILSLYIVRYLIFAIVAGYGEVNDFMREIAIGMSEIIVGFVAIAEAYKILKSRENESQSDNDEQIISES